MTDLATPNPTIPISKQSRLLVAAHTAMRADAKRLVGAVCRLPESDAQGSAALGRAFAELARLIHDHHWAEDDVIYPFLGARLQDFDIDVVALEDDHLDLDAVMTRIGSRLRLLAHDHGRVLRHDTHSELVHDAAAFDSILVDHLEREERVLVPAFDMVLSIADRRLLDTKESKLASYRHLRMATPWLLANATPLEADQLRATAPGLVGLIHDHGWKRRFLKVMAPLYRTD